MLLNIVFPEHEHEYAIAVAQQTEAYRKPQYDMPVYLRNRPHSVQAECLANMASAKQFNSSDIITDKEGLFTLKSGDKSYSVNILSGHCSCPYFTKRNIPCKHMFAIFNLLPQQWSWHDLPMCLTNSAYMTLDTGMLLLKEEAMSGDLEGCSTETQADLDLSTFVCGSDAKNELPSDVSTSEIHWMSQSNGESFQKIPKKQTLGHKLRLQQKKAHELLTKCKDVCYLTTDSSVLKTVIQDAEKIYSRLIKSTGVNNTGECLPVFPVLA